LWVRVSAGLTWGRVLEMKTISKQYRDLIKHL
jgi:hypothetical protein